MITSLPNFFTSITTMVAPKKPLNDKGKIRIRFTHQGTRFTLSNLGDYDNPTALRKAQMICDKIKFDIDTGNFVAENNGELCMRYNPDGMHKFITKDIVKRNQEFLSEYSKSNGKVLTETIIDHSYVAPSLIEKLEKRLEEKYHSTDKSLLKLLQYWGKNISSFEDAKQFTEWLKIDRKASTVQRYLNTLKALSPYFKDIKVKSEKKPMPKPFTPNEIKLIINWFENSEVYNHYSDFVKCLFSTGMRTSEAIGMQWKHIDFDRNLILIYESLSRDGDNTSKRKRKPTKAGTVREFPMSGKLREMLIERYNKSNKLPNALVFPSPEGLSIDDHNFSQRAWKRCLEEIRIPHRPPYNCRHTFISNFLSKTKDVVKCAALTHGSKSGIETIYRNYAGLIDEIEVPDMF